MATTRGYAGTEAIECVHYGSVAIVDPSGRVVAGVGDTAGLNFTRSTLKPVQALPFVEDGGLARYGMGSHELALMCSSHSGANGARAAGPMILARIGAHPADLQCGTHPPR